MNKAEQLSNRKPSRPELEKAAGTWVESLALAADLEEMTGGGSVLAAEMASNSRTEDWHGIARALRELPERGDLRGYPLTDRHLNAAAAVLAEMSVRRFEIGRLLEGPDVEPFMGSLVESLERLDEAIMTAALELGRVLVQDDAEIYGCVDHEEPRLSAIE